MDSLDRCGKCEGAVTESHAPTVSVQVYRGSQPLWSTTRTYCSPQCMGEAGVAIATWSADLIRYLEAAP